MLTYKDFEKFVTDILDAVQNIPLDRLREICDAEREGRVIITPELGESDYEGLKGKYFVYKAKNNEPVDNCFVLRPDKDHAAIAALTAYALTTENKQLAVDILNWVEPDERVKILPCKVGDTVYVLPDYKAYWDDIEETKITGVTQFMDGDKVSNEVVTSLCLCFLWERDFGVSLFLTREEAEKALKESKRNE